MCVASPTYVLRILHELLNLHNLVEVQHLTHYAKLQHIKDQLIQGSCLGWQDQQTSPGVKEVEGSTLGHEED